MLTKSEILESIKHGFLEAARDYQDWSGNRTIHDAGIEFLATARIADSLISAARQDSLQSWIYLEMPFNLIKHSAGVVKHKPGRKPDILNGNPRVDLSYFDKTENVRGIIELKRHLSYGGLRRDFERVCALLDYYGRPYGKLKFGVVAAVRPITATQYKSINDVADDIVARFREDFDRPIDKFVKEEPLINAENIPYETSDTSEEGSFLLANGIGIACFYIGSSSSQ